MKKPRAPDAPCAPAPRTVQSRPRTRYLPAAVRRAVWQRDGGRCQYPLASGGVCGSTVRVELDHLDPWAKGGASTVARLRLCCEVHNQRAAREVYGDEVMARHTNRVSEPVAAYGRAATG